MKKFAAESIGTLVVGMVILGHPVCWGIVGWNGLQIYYPRKKFKKLGLSIAPFFYTIWYI